MKIVNKLKKDTIKAINGYRVLICKDKENGEHSTKRAVYDGTMFVMFAERKGAGDFIDNALENECFELCEVFTTERGGRYVYWRDNELDEDYITRINDALLGL